MHEDNDETAIATLEDYSVEFTYPDLAAALYEAGVIARLDVDRAADVTQETGHKEVAEGGDDYDEALRGAGIL